MANIACRNLSVVHLFIGRPVRWCDPKAWYYKVLSQLYKLLQGPDWMLPILKTQHLSSWKGHFHLLFWTILCVHPQFSLEVVFIRSIYRQFPYIGTIQGAKKSETHLLKAIKCRTSIDFRTHVPKLWKYANLMKLMIHHVLTICQWNFVNSTLIHNKCILLTRVSC